VGPGSLGAQWSPWSPRRWSATRTGLPIRMHRKESHECSHRPVASQCRQVMGSQHAHRPDLLGLCRPLRCFLRARASHREHDPEVSVHRSPRCAAARLGRWRGRRVLPRRPSLLMAQPISPGHSWTGRPEWGSPGHMRMLPGMESVANRLRPSVPPKQQLVTRPGPSIASTSICSPPRSMTRMQ
jgi:hypothetical protein